MSKKITGFYSEGRLFAERDRMMDRMSLGPLWLAHKIVGEAVRDTLLAGKQRGNYELKMWVIKPNHMHLLITPHQPL